MAKFNEGGRKGTTPANLPAPTGFEIHEPRCKICKSPHRREIDAALVSGMAQRTVKEYFNAAYGSDYFTDSNVSIHARKHMTLRDAAVRRIYEEAARREGIDLALAEGYLRTKRAFYENVVNEVSTLMQAGAINPEVRDGLAAAQLLEKIDAESVEGQLAELERQFRAFMTSVKEVVPEDLFGKIYETFAAKVGIDNQPAAIEPAVDGEVAEEES